ncbi:MAG: S8 family serine peptidase [Acidobacteria bacterium]|nr:S8 family serine peptidase [Acidobacteriota bacterium]
MIAGQVYHEGGQELREIRGMRALSSAAAAAALESRQAELSRLAAEARGPAEHHLALEDRAALAADGWAFAPAAEAAGAKPPGGHRLFLDTEGRAHLELPVVSLKLRRGLDEAQARAALRRLGLHPVRSLGFAPNLFEVESTGGERRSLDLASRLRERPEVEFAEPQLLQRAEVRLRPGGPRYAEQWQWGAIRAETAWDRTRGAGVRIAVIDLGMDISHPDLRPAVHGGGSYQRQAGRPSRFVSRASDPAGFPKHPHGTFCMGMAGARSNGTSGCGAAPEATLVPIAIDTRLSTQAALARALCYAADPAQERGSRRARGADIISCSLVPPNFAFLGPTLAAAIGFVAEEGRQGKGTLIFWAVDNSSVRIAQDRICSHPSVIAVGMSSRYDAWAGSATGPELDFLAPGLAVSSVLPDKGFGQDTGSSFAAPCAAGVAALVLALEPRLRWEEVRDRLRGSCEKVGRLPYVGSALGGRNDRYGYGRINAARAVL